MPAKRGSSSPWTWIPTLYLAEGLPYVVVMTVAVLMYKGFGVSNTDVALLTSWLYLPWVIKPLWSPVVEILGTRRGWIWVMQLLVGAAFALVALAIPSPDFLRLTLAGFWLLAFDSATHDIAADGFYMLATTEQQQAAFVGVRSMFYRIATITGQGLLVVLAGTIQSHTGLPRLELHAEAGTPVAVVAPAAAPLAAAGPLHVVADRTVLAIAPGAGTRAAADSVVAAAAAANRAAGHTSAPRAAAAPPGTAAGGWSTHVSTPLANTLRERWGADAHPGRAIGHAGTLHVRLSRPPGREVVLTLALRRGDEGIRIAEGARLAFDDHNWNVPASVAFQMEPAIAPGTSARFEVRSGNVPLSWTVVMLVLAVLFLGFGLWHRAMLPHPASDQPGEPRRVVGFLRDFLGTFGEFFRQPRIGLLLVFLLTYRLGEAQLVKLVGPFLLDDRARGGLGLTTTQVGIVYGTVGILALTIGGILGGWVVARHGLKRWLWPMLLILHVPDAAFLYLARVQPMHLGVIQICVAAEQFGYGFGLTAYLMYMIRISRGRHQTAHYAICTGFMALGMMLPGMWSGWLQTLIGYPHFFAWVLVATVPSFLVALGLPLEPEFGRRTGDAA